MPAFSPKQQGPAQKTSAPKPGPAEARPADGAAAPEWVWRVPAAGDADPARAARFTAQPAAPPLAVAPAADAAEAEADKAADAVASGAAAGVRGQPRAEGGAGEGAAPPSVQAVLRTPGAPLDAAARAFMEPRFGTGFGHVRVHTGPAADASARAVSAHAYAAGPHLVFSRTAPGPATTAGRRLLAHELAHVVQQGAGHPRVQRAAWTSVRADERDAQGGDKYGARTFEVFVSAIVGEQGKSFRELTGVSIFVPSGAKDTQTNKVHVFFSPGRHAMETGLQAGKEGLNAVMMHGMRGAAEGTEWIVIGVPGRTLPDGSEDDAYTTIDTQAIQHCLFAAGRPTLTIDALRYSSHSRGSRGLRETIAQKLIPSPAPDRVVVFDAPYSSLDTALKDAKIPGSSIISLNVNEKDQLTGATNKQLDKSTVLAIGYSRLILDAQTIDPALKVPQDVKDQLLPLPPRGKFTFRTVKPGDGMTNIDDFQKAHDNEIKAIIRDQVDPKKGLKAFIDTNKLTRMGWFDANILAHHLFVAEFAHEVSDTMPASP